MAIPETPDLTSSVTDSMNGSIGSLVQDPASLVHEVEHIKELVRLSSASAQQGISSQIFRRSFQPQVVPSQVLKELDTLKRRLKRASGSTQQHSPEDTEDDEVAEAEAEEIKDERLREIANIRAELDKVKSEREEWMENAENRIDILIAEKDDMAKQLQDTIERLKESESERAEIKQSLQALILEKDKALDERKVAEGQLAELRKQSQKYQELHAQAATSLQSLEQVVRGAEKDKAALQALLDDAIVKVKQLEDGLAQTSASVTEAERKIQSLEEIRAEMNDALEKKATEINELRHENTKAINHVEEESARKLTEVTRDIEKLDQSRAHLEAELSATRSELENAKNQLSSAQSSKDKEMADAEARFAALSRSLEEAQLQIAELDKTHQRTISRLEEEHQATLQKSLEEHEDAWQTKTEHFELELAEMRKARDVTIAELEQKHQKDIESRSVAQSEELRRVEAKSASEIQQLRAAHEEQISERESAHSNSLNEARQAHEAAIAEVQGRLETTAEQHRNMLTAIKTRFEEKSADMRSQHEAQLMEERKLRGDESSKAHTAILEAKQAHSEALAEAESRFQSRIAELEAESTQLREDLAAARFAHDAKDRDVAAKHAEQVQTLQRTADEKLEKVRSEYQQGQERAVQEAEDRAQKALVEHEKAAINAQESARKEVEELQIVHAEKLDKVQRDLTAQVEDAQNKHEASRSELAALKTSHDQDIEKMKHMHSEELLDLKKKHNDISSSAQAAQAESKAALEALEDKFKMVRREKVTAEVQLRRQIQNMEEEHDNEMKAVKAQAEDAKAELIEKLQSSDSDLKAKLEALNAAEQKLSDAVAAQEDIMRQAKEDHQKALHEAEQKHAQTIKQHQEALQEAERNHQDSTRDIDQARRAAEEELSAARATLDSLRLEHEESLASVRREFESALSEAQRVHAEEMEKIKEGAESSKVQAVASVREKLQAAHTQLVENDKDHEEKLANLGKEHESKVSSLEKAHADKVSALEQDSSVKLSEAQALHAKELEDLKGTAEAVKETAVSFIQDKLQATQTQLNQLEKGHAEVLSKLQTEHAEKLSELEKEHSGKTTDLEKQLSEAQKSHAEAMDNLREGAAAAKDNAVRSVQESLQSAKTQIVELERKHNETIKSLQADLDSKMSEAEKAHAEDMDRLRVGSEAAKDQAVMSIQGKLQETKSRLVELEKNHEAAISKHTEQSESKSREMAAQHEAVVSALKIEHEKHVLAVQEELKLQTSQELQARIDAISLQHQQELQSYSQDADAKIAELEKVHEQERSENQRAIELLKTEAIAAGQRAEAQADQAKEAVERLEQAHNQNLTNLKQEAAAQLAELNDAHKKAMSDAAEAAEADKLQTLQHYEQSLNQARLSSARSIEDLRIHHDEELATLREDMELHQSTAVREIQENLQKQLQEMGFKLTEAEEREARSKENILKQEEAQLQWHGELEKAKGEHRAELAKALTDAQVAADVVAAERDARHVEEVERARQASKQEGERQLEEVEKIHKITLEDIKKSTDGRLADLQESHNKALANANEESERTLSLRIEELRSQHQLSLDKALTEARSQADKHHVEIRALRENSDADILATRERLELLESMSSQFESEKNNMSAEVEALIAQLNDREFQARERDQTHADQLKVATEKLTTTTSALERTLSDTRSGYESTLNTLRSELEEVNDRAKAQRESLTSALEDLQQQRVSAANARDQFAEQLALSEEERQKSAKCILELTSEREEHRRQMEALTTQMKELHIELDQSKQRDADNTDLQQKLRKLQDKLADAISENKALRSQRHIPARRPMTPEVMQSKASEGLNHTSSGRSFEEYLEQAQSELSELGKVISHNESLFAAKIQQHVGDLQHAKDQLAKEYKAKFDSLTTQRAELEGHAQSQHRSELEAARNELRDGYERDINVPSNHPELNNAESRLILVHQQELTKKKSQIALTHAFRFQALNEEYDRRVAELSGDKNNLDSDLSIEPDRFERLAGELDAISEQLSAEKYQSLPGSPDFIRRLSSPTSLRRVSGTDDLRSASPAEPTSRRSEQVWRAPDTYSPSGLVSADGLQPPRARHVQQQRTPTKASRPRASRSSTEHLRLSTSSSTNTSRRASPTRIVSTPIAQPSPGHARETLDSSVTRRTVERPRTSEKWASPADTKTMESIDFGVDPLEFERRRKSAQAVEAAKFAMAGMAARSSMSGSGRPGSSSGSSSRPGSSQARPGSSSHGRPGSSGRLFSGGIESPRSARH